MIELNTCKPSPRIEPDGTLYMYEGDTACIDFEIELSYIYEEQAIENPIYINPTDKVRVCFKDALFDKKIYEFEFTNIQDNTITLCFTKELTKLFKKGSYTYCVHVEMISDDEVVKTIAYKNKMVIE